jgi:hypothetical protein
MTWRAAHIAIVVAASIWGWLGAPPAAQAQGLCVDFLTGCAITKETGIGWHYSAEHRAFFQTPSSVVEASNTPEVEWTAVPACGGNDPTSDTGAVCPAALCTTPTGEPGVEFWVFSRLLDPPDSAWRMQGSRCIPGERRVDLADVEAEVQRILEDRFREVAAPSIELAPAVSGLVNLPVLAWTDDPGEFRLQIEQPLPGAITATPEYRWVWSNGTTSQGPGTPYSPSVSPTEQDGYYVSSVFDRRGEASVALTVTWTGAVAVPGLAPVPISPLVYTASASLPIQEARAVLVDSGP